MLTSAYLCKPTIPTKKSTNSTSNTIAEYKDIDAEYKIQAEKRIKASQRIPSVYTIKSRLKKVDDEKSRYSNKEEVKKSKNIIVKSVLSKSPD